MYLDGGSMKKKLQKGVTLIELVVSVSLLAVIILTSLSVLSFGQKSFTSVIGSGEIQTEADNIMANITAQVHKSSSLPVITSGTLLTLSNSTTFQWNSTAHTLTYAVGGVTKAVFSNVTFLSFALPSGASNGVVVDIRLSSGTQNYEFKTSVYTRML
jgi:prepilin-type N-terminal cleavage/methylation domain-containing protein